MARRMMLKDMRTGRWGWYSVGRPVRMPWEGVWTGLRWVFRYARRHSALFPTYPPVYDFDPDTLDMRDPKRERRQRRRDRRDRLIAKMSDALNAMVEMQKHVG